jgi:N-acetyl-gamma-glutamyl-phosphate reductase/acetylglutamate kinase
MREFYEKGRDMFGEINLEGRIHKAAKAAMNLSGVAQQARAFSTANPRPSAKTMIHPRVSRSAFAAASLRGYATIATTTTNPNPPFGTKNATNDRPAKVALVGARGCKQIPSQLTLWSSPMRLRKNISRLFLEHIFEASAIRNEHS